MEEYLQYMKTLNSQMNVEDRAAKVSVEEQMQLTTIQTLENDLNSAISETKRLMEEQMKNAKGQVCSLILEKQRKIASLESDSSSLIQALELIDQERIDLSSKLIEKRLRIDLVRKEGRLVLITTSAWATRKNLMNMLDSAKAKLDEILQMKSELVIENCKTKQAIEQVNLRENDFKPELRAMDIKSLEEEFNALLSGKAGETEYLEDSAGPNCETECKLFIKFFLGV